MRRVWRGLVYAAAVMVTLGACGGADAPSNSNLTMATPSSVTAMPARVPIGEVLDDGRARARVALGDDGCLDVLVADEQAERERGLMNRDDLGDADGMLFVWATDVDSAFYMFQTRLALDIGWYAADGSAVDRTTMDPCPARRPEDCPIHSAAGRYRYALEMPEGELGPGALTGCVPSSG
jgi:uncharacterized membrane protein (UPF0127 family)